MSEQDNSTRLARLEASLEFIKDFLKDMREDVKGLPTKEDYLKMQEDHNKLEERIQSLEKSQLSLAIKVGAVAATMSVLIPIIVRMVMK